MKVTGKIEVFKNKRGYLTAVFKSFDKVEDTNKVTGSSFIDADVDASIIDLKALKEGDSVNLDVEEGYLNSRHVEGKQESFNKLVLNIVKAKVIREYHKN